MKCVKLFPLCLALLSAGCSSSGSLTPSAYSKHSYSEPTYVRSTTGETQFRIQDNNIYKPDGVRVARIDSTGNVFTTTGVRVARIGKK